jgi:hypothetical protein
MDVVVARRGSTEALEDALAKGTAPWVLFLDEQDVPDEALVETLVRAQARSGADVVSCGLRTARGLQLFSGQPGGVGVLANDYGAVGLIRRDALAHKRPAWPADSDPGWQLLAGLTIAGANVVSLPEPLVTRRVPTGIVEDDPGDALLVVHELERALPRPLRGAARLAAGLAANAPRSDGTPESPAGIARLVLRLRTAARRLSGPRR